MLQLLLACRLQAPPPPAEPTAELSSPPIAEPVIAPKAPEPPPEPVSSALDPSAGTSTRQNGRDDRPASRPGDHR